MESRARRPWSSSAPPSLRSLSAELPDSHNAPGDYECFFRMHDRIPVYTEKTNGGLFEQLASNPARQWLLDLRERNRDFWEAFAPLAGQTYHTNEGPKPAWDAVPADALFGLGCIVQRPGADAADMGGWHVDGGASLLSLAIGIFRDRVVEFETADGDHSRLLLCPGDWYVGMPGCIKHRVVRAGGPSTSLLLRTAVLTRRKSEKRVYGTRTCFESLARAVADIIAAHPFDV